MKALLFVLMVVLAGCTGNQPGQEYQLRTDMYDQPSFRHNEDPRAIAEGTVQTKGFMPAISDSIHAAHLKNPYEFTRESIDTARFLFDTYCSVCHGVGARGDGLVAPKFQTPPDLTSEKYIKAPEGYIYSVIRNGRLIMPAYFENTSARERWLIVSHVRSLQKR